MSGLVVMFGVFLLGLWLEARRSLRTVANDQEVPGEVAAAVWESDYHVVMARRAARLRLAALRARPAVSGGFALDGSSSPDAGLGGARYDLHVPEFRLIEGGGAGRRDAQPESEDEGRLSA